MNTTTDIRIDIKSAIIVFLSACVIMVSLCFITIVLTNHENQAWKQKEINTNNVLSQIPFPRNMANAFIQLDWKNIRIQQLPLMPEAPIVSEEQNKDEGE